MFAQSTQINVGLVPEVRPRPLLWTSSHSSDIIRALYIRSELGCEETKKQATLSATRLYIHLLATFSPHRTFSAQNYVYAMPPYVSSEVIGASVLPLFAPG